jgi:broad specificity phosphatase PhoE
MVFWKHGESQYNLEGKIGGDAPLSYRGEQYATALPGLVKEIIGDKPLEVISFFDDACALLQFLSRFGHPLFVERSKPQRI